jgi:hypothetical protein
MRETGITDLTPIANSSIKSIWMDDFYVQMSKEKARTVLSILQGMPNLRKLNGKDISK